MSYVNKYVALLTLFGLAWLGFLGVAYFNITGTDDIDVDEMHSHARHTGQQISEVFSWFDEKRMVLVPESLSEVKDPSINPRILANNGLRLAMPLPIDLARRLENQVQNGVIIRFVSDAPLNPNNRASPSTNRAIMAAFDSNNMDYFEYQEDTGLYSYVRPLTAMSSCISCHIRVPVGGFIGSLVIDIDPEDFIHAERSQKQNMVLFSVIGSFVTILLFYFLMFLVWRRKRSQDSGVEQAQNVVANMSQDIELALGNMSNVLKELGQCVDDFKRTELLNSLQNINKDLLDTSFKLQVGDNRVNHAEEIFHVEELVEECAQIFKPNCNEKGISLDIKVDPSVPTYLLGNAYYLKQALGRLIKYSVLYTNKGSVVVRVRSVDEISTSFSGKVKTPSIINVIIEIEDTGRGFMVTDKQSLLQGFAQSAGKGTKSNIRPIISLTPVNEIAAMMNGSVTMPRNTKEGSCFRLSVQMKIVDEKLVAMHEKEQQKSNEANDNIDANNGNKNTSQAEQVERKNVPEAEVEAGPMSVIIADSDIDKLSDQTIKLWNKENFIVTHMTTTSMVCSALANANHGYKAVLVRAVADMEALVAVIKMRQAEHADANPAAIILISDTEIETDMDVLHYFNISTADHVTRQPQELIDLAELALVTLKNKIFQGDEVLDRSSKEKNPDRIFNMRRAMEHANNNRKAVLSKCSMWVHFYPTQMERTESLISEGSESDMLRLIQSLKNSAQTVSLPMLYAEARRLETKILNGKPVRYEKLIAVYEQTFHYMKEKFD